MLSANGARVWAAINEAAELHGYPTSDGLRACELGTTLEAFRKGLGLTKNQLFEAISELLAGDYLRGHERTWFRMGPRVPGMPGEDRGQPPAPDTGMHKRFLGVGDLENVCQNLIAQGRQETMNLLVLAHRSHRARNGLSPIL